MPRLLVEDPLPYRCRRRKTAQGVREEVEQSTGVQ